MKVLIKQSICKTGSDKRINVLFAKLNALLLAVFKISAMEGRSPCRQKIFYGWLQCFALVMALSFIIPVYAADPIYNLDDFSTSGVGNWTNDAPNKVELNASDGYLNAEHLAQTVPIFVEDTVKLPISPGSFITQLSCKLSALDMPPSRVRLQFHSKENDNTWSLNLPVPQVGQVLTVDKQLLFSEGWTLGAASQETQFNQDIHSVDWVGIQIRRAADVARQNYAIDDFLVQGLYYITDSDHDQIADAWETRYGLSSNNVADAQLDSDGDGVSNYAEYRAGTNPNDRRSYFITMVRRKRGDSQNRAFELRWNSTTNRTYSIWRSYDLRSGFTKIATGIHATPPENIYEANAATNSALFYRIEVDPEL